MDKGRGRWESNLAPTGRREEEEAEGSERAGLLLLLKEEFIALCRLASTETWRWVGDLSGAGVRLKELESLLLEVWVMSGVMSSLEESDKSKEEGRREEEGWGGREWIKGIRQGDEGMDRDDSIQSQVRNSLKTKWKEERDRKTGRSDSRLRSRVFFFFRVSVPSYTWIFEIHSNGRRRMEERQKKKEASKKKFLLFNCNFFQDRSGEWEMEGRKTEKKEGRTLPCRHSMINSYQEGKQSIYGQELGGFKKMYTGHLTMITSISRKKSWVWNEDSSQ